MSQVQPFGPTAGTDNIRHSIARAAEATGVDFDYLLAQAKLESGLDPKARANTSSAAGLFQFINNTWLETLDRHGASHGLGWAGAAIASGNGKARVSDPAMRAQIMALRDDPEIASLMAGELAGDNRAALTARFGREPDNVELYLAHFMGRDGAISFLEQLHQTQDAIAAQLFPQQAAANRPIFYDSAGQARSLGGVMAQFRQRFDRALDNELPALAAASLGAMGTPGVPPGQAHRLSPHASLPPAGPLQREFERVTASRTNGSHASMAQTLHDAFGGSEGRGAAMPAAVRAAYDRLGAFRL